MIRLRLITSVIGYLLFGYVFLMIIPLIVAFLSHQPDSIYAFSACILICLGFGHLAMRADKKASFDDLNRVESIAVVSFGWLTLSLLGAIPYLFFGFSTIDAFFESMSGFTTTGSTILKDFTALNSSMFFYRGFTQWIGGLGILVVFVALLPQLAIAGRQLFFAEVSAESKDKLSPRIKDTANQLLAWYVILTVLCILGLCFAGMDIKDAAPNAFSTIAAAGFSPNSESIYGYHNPAVEWVLIVCMLFAGGNFVLQVKVVRTFLDYLKERSNAKKSVKSRISFFGNIKSFLTNSELVAYLFIILLASGIVVLILWCNSPENTSIEEIIRQSAFQCLSVMTTTGSASFDYEYWPIAAKSVLVVLMFIGGCSGSAGGGMKVIRILILVRYFWKILLKNIYPEAVVRIKLDNRTLRESDVLPILTFCMFYMASFFIGGTIVCVLENSFVVGYSGAIACLGNIGPGFQSIGPMGNFADWHFISKLIGIFLMWAGRLEVMALIVFLRPEVWRGSRW